MPGYVSLCAWRQGQALVTATVTEHRTHTRVCGCGTAVSRRFVAMTEHGLGDLLAGDLTDLDLASEPDRRRALRRPPMRGRAGHRHRRDKHPLALVEGSTENTTLVRGLLVGLQSVKKPREKATRRRSSSSLTEDRRCRAHP